MDPSRAARPRGPLRLRALGVGALVVGSLPAVAGCSAPAARPVAAPAPSVVVVLSADADRAAVLGRSACSSWRAAGRATDLAAFAALQRAADAASARAAALDPRWRPLADDLAQVAALQAAYVKANVNAAYALSPRLQAATDRVPSHCR